MHDTPVSPAPTTEGSRASVREEAVMASERQHTTTGGEAAVPVTARSTMRAIVQDGYGSAGVWHLARIAPPEPGTGEVLLQVLVPVLQHCRPRSGGARAGGFGTRAFARRPAWWCCTRAGRARTGRMSLI